MPLQAQAAEVHRLGQSKLAKAKKSMVTIWTSKKRCTGTSIGLAALRDLEQAHQYGARFCNPKTIPPDLVRWQVFNVSQALTKAKTTVPINNSIPKEPRK